MHFFKLDCHCVVDESCNIIQSSVPKAIVYYLVIISPAYYVYAPIT